MTPTRNIREGEGSAENHRIALVAAKWLVKRDRGLSGAEQDEYCQWLAADPRHGEWLARHQKTWRNFNLLAQWKPEHSSEPNPDLLAQLTPKRRIEKIWFTTLAAAACVALALLAWAPWINASKPAPTQRPENIAQVYERRVLEDGSIVELNRGAGIEVVYTAAERNIRLIQGEVNFTVAKNAHRPFIVRASGVAVRAVGTVFNVRMDPKNVEVLVTEGKVRVSSVSAETSASDESDMPLLTAGERAVVSLTSNLPPQVAQLSSEEITRLLSWQPQLLDFSSTPLMEVVAEFNQRNQVQLVVGSPELNNVPIVASFRSDNVEGFLRLLELTAGVTTERSGDVITLKKSR